MKVVAINASPRMDKGVIGMILAPFVDGKREGALKSMFTAPKNSASNHARASLAAR